MIFAEWIIVTGLLSIGQLPDAAKCHCFSLNTHENDCAVVKSNDIWIVSVVNDKTKELVEDDVSIFCYDPSTRKK